MSELVRNDIAQRIAAACAVEPIHQLGSIQPHGVLLAVEAGPGFPLACISANAAGLPGAADVLAHSTLEGVLGGAFAGSLRQRMKDGELSAHDPWESVVTPPGHDTAFDAACHAHDGLVVIELEEADAASATHAPGALRGLQQAIARMRGELGGVEALAQSTVESIRAVTGYERVLVYRFDEDWNGQAIAEDQVDDWEQRLFGLHFPASDIPAQAREMYRRSLMRWVPSRDAEASPLLLAPGRTRPIDLTHARLRSLSPVHLQYHRNMGVDGTMSLSIMVDDRLWGLVVCHHRRPHKATPGQRIAAAALTDAFALRIVPAERAGVEAVRLEEQRQIGRLVSQMAQVDELALALTTGDVTLRDLFEAGGAAVVQGRRVTLVGAAPPRPDVERLAHWLRETAPAGPSYATAVLPAVLPGWVENRAVASGLLALFLTEDRADMLLWFRPEEAMEVSWGGVPHKAADAAGTLMPRESFERWTEMRHGQAQPWLAWQVELAGVLRHAITEVIARNLRRIGSLNEQLRQSQKMEAVGQLTGGLAHDFNNLLGGITGSLELARIRISQGRTGELDRYLAAAAGAARRAAALTHRLLAFSRRQTLDPKPTDVGRLVCSMEELVGRTVGPSIVVEAVTSAGLWTVLCDANQLENALLNLSLNARDAMADGGRLTIEATNSRVDDAMGAQLRLPPGHYVAISVSDSGSGMSAETVSRAFEPFFTTKPLGEGTGLGLSMVYGFAQQSGGHARIYSEPGQGTTVRLMLPRHLGPAEAEEAPARVGPGALERGATVLVVDDEPVLRMLVCEVLREQGLTVLEAANGKQALAHLGGTTTFDLLLTDVGLPGGMNGRQVAEAARELYPTLKVLFITGYAENAALDGGVLDPMTQVMTKPFDMQALSSKVAAMVA